MSSPYTLPPLLHTLQAATTRILPPLLHTPSTLIDTLIALTPVVTSFWLTLLLIVLQLTLSALTRSYAWNDRLWSLIPPLYTLPYTLHPPLSKDPRTNATLDVRLTLMCTLVWLWGIRLTFNAARRGVYSPNFIDHRYDWIRKTYIPNPLLFTLTYILFSCTLTTILLSLATSPLYFAWLSRGTTLTPIDYLATLLILFFLTIETIADNQQATFQSLKKSTTPPPPFLQTGLFAHCRHPNFTAEISLWWSFYLFSISTSPSIFNWTILGAILYTLLFQLTTPLTERISAQKYPSYASYQRRVPSLIPSLLPKSKTA